MKKITQAVILAGGQGTRLRPLTKNTPKPLIPIHGKPFVQYILEQLKENNIDRVLFLTGYLGNQIEKYFGDRSTFGLSISYSQSPVEYETGLRIKKALPLIDETFLLIYSDNYWPLDLDELTNIYFKMKKPALVTIYSNKDYYTKNNMLVNKRGLVKTYDKTGKTKTLNGVDIGFFILNKSIFKNSPDKNFPLEYVLQKLIKEKQLAGLLTHHKYYGLSTIDRIPGIEEFLKPKKIVLLDRDGVINKKPKPGEYITKAEDFSIMPSSLQGLKLLSDKGYELYIITNQPGIARKKLAETELKKIHKKLLNECKQHGIVINDIYYCPHGWNDGCFCRKPNPGMLFRAAAEYKFDLTKAIFIGDDQRDEQAGIAANCKTILMKENENLLSIIKKNRSLFR